MMKNNTAAYIQSVVKPPTTFVIIYDHEWVPYRRVGGRVTDHSDAIQANRWNSAL
jgi:hypothetical protein